MSESGNILRLRTKALAQPRAIVDDVSTLEILEFELAGVRFGVPTRYVRTVHSLDQLTPLPGAPDYVAGIAHVRGELLAVLDARSLLGVDETGIANFHKVVVLEQGAMAFGVLVDAVASVRRVPDEALHNPSGRLLGMTDEGLAVIDANALLCDESLVVNEEVAAGREL